MTADAPRYDGRDRGDRPPGPWGSSRFWLLQLVVLALYLVRLALTVSFHLHPQELPVELSTAALFVVPVVAAATSFGFEGALVTAGWVTLLGVPRITVAVGQHHPSAAWTEVLQLALIDALAVVLGHRVSSERRARLQAERARQEQTRTQALYRELFDASRSPILILDADGRVVESNPAADAAFARGRSAGATSGRDASDLPRLVDVIGPTAAGGILTQLVAGRLGRVDDHRHDGPTDNDHADQADPANHADPADPGRAQPFEVEVDGGTVVLRPTVTVLPGSGTTTRMQVVFEDVTAETLRRDRMEAYATQVVLGQEEERRHLAQELHDGPLQTLIHLCRQIDAIGDHDGPDAVAALRPLVEGTVDELRTIARGLRPSVLDDLGLVASIDQSVSEAAARSGLAGSFTVDGDPRRLDATTELSLFRIAQEALSNVERHAAARAVSVRLTFAGPQVCLVVTDDGVGFTPELAGRSPGRGLGMTGMTERAHLIGADLSVTSTEGRGTTVQVTVG